MGASIISRAVLGVVSGPRPPSVSMCLLSQQVDIGIKITKLVMLRIPVKANKCLGSFYHKAEAGC